MERNQNKDIGIFNFISLIFALLLISNTIYAHGPEFIWADRYGGADVETPYDITTDESGNIYMTGIFDSTTIFGSTELTSEGQYDAFIVKLDNNGNVIWAKSAGGPEWDQGSAIVADEYGNCYVTGTFTFTATFDSRTIYAQGVKDMFIAKYDASGNLVWVNSHGGLDVPDNHDDDIGNDIAIDGSGNIWLTGQFWGVAHFDPYILSSHGEADMFLVKYDQQGHVLCYDQIGGTEKDGGNHLTIDNHGNVYVAGYFRDVLSVEGAEYTCQGEWDIFIAKFNNDADLVSFNTAGSPNRESIYGFQVDHSGNIYCCGEFNASITFDDITMNSMGKSDIFINKYSASGVLVYAKQAGSSGSDYAIDLTLDNDGNVTITGYFTDTITFDDTTVTGVAYQDAYIARYSSNGELAWAHAIAGPHYDRAYAITTDYKSDHLVAGTFWDTLPVGNTSATSAGVTDIFLAKFITKPEPQSDLLMEQGSIIVPAASTRLKVHAGGDYVYMVDYGATPSDGALYIADVSDRSNPILRGSVPNITGINVHDLWYKDNYVFTTHRGSPVMMIDVSNPDNPFIVSSANITYNHAGIRTFDNYLYVAEHSSSNNPGGVKVFDVSGGILNEVGFYHGDVDGRFLCITNDGSTMYQSSAADDWPPEEILIYDLSDKSNPVLLKSFNEGLMAFYMAISPDDRYLYMSVGPDGSPVQGFQIWDISDKNDPQMITDYDDVLFYNFAFYAEEQIIFASAVFDQTNAIYALDVSDPSDIQILETFSGIGGELSIDGGYLYVGDPGPGEVGLRFYQINVSAGPNVLHVPEDYLTIQEAIDAAADGDTILVAPGSYDIISSISNDRVNNLQLIGSRKEDGSDASIIKPTMYQGNWSAIFFNNVSGCTIAGFEIENAYDGISLNNCSDCVVTRNHLHHNFSVPAGPGIGFYAQRGSNIEISYCVLDSNEQHGICLYGLDNCRIINNTVLFSMTKNGISVLGSDISIENNILAWNNKEGIEVLSSVLYQGPVLHDYNCFWANGGNENIKGDDIGPHSFDADPMLVDIDNGNYHLMPGSPCLGAGENGVDIGAMGLQQTTCLLGDVNNDGAISPGDALCAFRIYLSGGAPPPDCDNPCALSAADIDCTPNGITPGDALYIFQAYLSGQHPPLDCNPGTCLVKSRSENTMQLHIPNLVRTSDDDIMLPIQINDGSGISAFGLSLHYPADLLSFTGASSGELTQNWEHLDAAQAEPGILVIGGFHPIPIASEVQGSLIQLTFRMKRDAGGEGEFDITGMTDDLFGANAAPAEFSVNGDGINMTARTPLPKEYALWQNYPNPFNLETRIHFELPEDGHVTIKIYNVLGMEVETLVDGYKSAGYYSLVWDGRNQIAASTGSGLYICRIKVNGFRKCIKMLLLK